MFRSISRSSENSLTNVFLSRLSDLERAAAGEGWQRRLIGSRGGRWRSGPCVMWPEGPSCLSITSSFDALLSHANISAVRRNGHVLLYFRSGSWNNSCCPNTHAEWKFTWMTQSQNMQCMSLYRIRTGFTGTGSWDRSCQVTQIPLGLNKPKMKSNLFRVQNHKQWLSRRALGKRKNTSMHTDQVNNKGRRRGRG